MRNIAAPYSVLSILSAMKIRKIIHIDMDAFYASVEQRDNPGLRGRPVAVGQADGRGVVAAASYEARRYGVRSAMSSSKARKMCPGLVFVNCDFEKYKRVSAQIHEIFHEYTDIIEPISLDEAFLDVTENFPGMTYAVDIAREIKRKVRERLELVASAGVSFNKFLAKIASDYRKPDGLCVIPPERAADFIAKMPVESFWGVGPVTAAKMHSLGVYTGLDLRALSPGELQMHFGKTGAQYYNFARGLDNRPVESERVRKSVGCENTFEEDIEGAENLEEALTRTCRQLAERLDRKDFDGTTLTLKLRFADFTTVSRCMSADVPFRTPHEIEKAARPLLEKANPETRPIRLMGLSVSKHEKASPAADSRQLLLDL